MPETQEQDHWLLLSLVKTVDKIERSVDELKDQRMREVEQKVAVIETKLGRLEWLMYGALALLATEGIALIAQWLAK